MGIINYTGYAIYSRFLDAHLSLQSRRDILNVGVSGTLKIKSRRNSLSLPSF